LSVFDQESCGRATCLGALGIIFFCGGCNRIPPLTEYANEPTTLSEVLSYTPAIIVGTIAGPQSFVGPYRQSRWVWDREWTVQLVRVPVDVETVLGSDQKVPTGQLDVYYYLWTVNHSYVGPPRLGSWQVGDRFIFFLRRERGYFRTICDEYKGCAAIQVFSGAHPGTRTGVPADLIVDILLNRGHDVTDGQMAKSIGVLSRVADCDPEYAVKSLQSLMKNGSRPIAEAACTQLKWLLYGCVPSPWNRGKWAAVCNAPPKISLSCPGPPKLPSESR
jgi:hypothetical protein